MRDQDLSHKQDKSLRLFAIGSVLHNARDGETVWGSGINAKIPEAQHRFRRLDVRGIRDPARVERALDPHDFVGAVLAVDHGHRTEEALAADVLLAQIAQAPVAGSVRAMLIALRAASR